MQTLVHIGERVKIRLFYETLDSENPIIPFDNDSIVSCWNTYYQKANAS